MTNTSDMPGIQTQCEEQYETLFTKKWKRCTRDAEAMVVLQHFGNHCGRQVIALCEQHLETVEHNLRVIQLHLQHQIVQAGKPEPCQHCGQLLSEPDDVGIVTKI